MTDRDDTFSDPLRQTFEPDSAAVGRVIEHALTGRRPRRLNGGLYVAVALLISGVAFMFRAWPSDSSTAGQLSNQGEIYVSRSSAGVWIHNNPQPEPATFQIISTGASE